MKVAVISNVPAPYREPIFERLSDSVKLLVIYQYMPEGRKWRVLKESTYPYTFDSPLSALNSFRPDALLVYGYSYRNAVEGILWAMTHRVPFLMRTDSNIYDDFYKPFWKRRLKKFMLSAAVRRVNAFLSIGKRNTLYWLHYGAEEGKIKRARYTVEIEYFSTRSKVLRARRREVLSSLGLEEGRYMLYAGRLVPVKGVDLLLKAFAHISPIFKDVRLIICGDGPERRKLEDMAFPKDKVIFVGDVPREKIVEFYSVSECLVLPSLFEPWGLVVNEAMASGLPCIVSDVCGCVDDMILEGVTGWTFKRGDVRDLEDKMNLALTSDLETMGKNAQALSCEVTYDQVARVFLRAFEEVGR